MVVWLPWFWLLLVPLYSVTGQDKHYMGGSISFVCNSTVACRLTVITGWKPGEGPCGPSCGLTKIGWDTRVTRRQMEEDHGQSYFGTWDLSGDASTFFDNLNNTMSSYVSAVNTPGGWEQEVLETDVVLGSSKQDKIRLSGLYWRRFHFNYVENISSVLHVDLNPLIRNDTGLPNNSPVVMFKPLYRIPLNKATKIVLSTMDRDGDYVWCEVPPSILTAVKLMPKTTISKDCSITVEANKQDGFLDKGYGVVTLVARDFNRHGLSLGGETRKIGRLLSTVIVQFMILTVESVEGPSFLPPTRESHHVFIVYIGSVLEIPLYATTGKFNISEFQVRSLPRRVFTVTSPVTMTDNGTNVISTTVSWKPTPADVGEYLFSATAIDEKGRDSLDRNYKLIVKESEKVSPPRKQSSTIYFKETVKVPFHCMLHATCTVFVSIATEPVGGQVLNVTATRVSTAQVQITPPQKINDSYISYITFTFSTPGNSLICLKATGFRGEHSDEFCPMIYIPPKDPCKSGPCVHGVCESEKDQFSCMCEEGYTDIHCETAISITPTTVTPITTTPTSTTTVQRTTATTRPTTASPKTLTSSLTTTTPKTTMPTTTRTKQRTTTSTITSPKTTMPTTTTATPTTTPTTPTTTTATPTTATTTSTTTTAMSTIVTTTTMLTTTTTPTTTTTMPTSMQTTTAPSTTTTTPITTTTMQTTTMITTTTTTPTTTAPSTTTTTPTTTMPTTTTTMPTTTTTMPTTTMPTTTTTMPTTTTPTTTMPTTTTTMPTTTTTTPTTTMPTATTTMPTTTTIMPTTTTTMPTTTMPTTTMPTTTTIMPTTTTTMPTTTMPTTTTTMPTTTTTMPTTTTTTPTTTMPTTTTTMPTTTTTMPTTTTTMPTTTTTTPTTTTPTTTTTMPTTTTTTPTTTKLTTTTTTPTTTNLTTTSTTPTTTTTTLKTTTTLSTTKTTNTITTLSTTLTPLSISIPELSALISSDPAVHRSASSTSGFPSCTEVVNPHPSTQCICLSGNQLVQCPFRKLGTVNSQRQDDTGSTSILAPVLGCVAGLTAGLVAIFVIKKFCCPCSKTNKVGPDSLQSLKQEDEEPYIERKPRAQRQYPPHHRNTPRKPRKLNPSRY